MPATTAKTKRTNKKRVITKYAFYDLYTISLCLDKLSHKDLIFVSEILDDIYDRYMSVTMRAIRHELRHAVDGGRCEDEDNLNYWDAIEINTKKLKKLDLNPDSMGSSRYRHKIDAEIAYKIFSRVNWHPLYGGERWAAIARHAVKMSKIKKVTPDNCKKVVSLIDHLHDMEHNTSLFLDEYTTFDLHWHLNNKFEADLREIVYNSSKEVRDICSKYLIII